jgi:cystathionine beta-lyase/cystathionine gamma-synthase
MTFEESSPDTLAIHAGDAEPRIEGAPVVPPVIQSATFFGGGPDDEGPLLYSRYGTNPNQLRVGRKVAALEGAEDGLALASGMAAISLTLLALARSGDHLVSSSHLYGATRVFMEEELPRRGVSVTFVDPDHPRTWRGALRPETRALYLEVPTNPTLRLFDLRPVGALARERGIPLVVDATFATPVNLRPLEHGADVVLHSATKYLGGHSDLMGGVVCGPEALVAEVRHLLHLYGPCLDPHAAWLLDRGIRTLGVRVARHNENAEALAEWFAGQDGVAGVVHPSRPDHPDHRLAGELLRGTGGMLGVVLEGGAEAAERFVQAVRLAALAPSLGGVETLVSLPRLTSHRNMDRAAREAMGIDEGFVRISVGIEGVQDLASDFGQALAAARAGAKAPAGFARPL